MPAQSPTLSPTLSAITPGFRGSSSGMPTSILPTKSVPTSAALVNIPPPSLAKTEIKLAPKPKPIRTSVSEVRKYKPDIKSNAKATTKKPVTDPALKAKVRAEDKPFEAAAAVLELERTATIIPKYPAKAEDDAPNKNPKAIILFKVKNNRISK